MDSRQFGRFVVEKGKKIYKQRITRICANFYVHRKQIRVNSSDSLLKKKEDL